MENPSKYLRISYWSLAFIVFILLLFRAAIIPFCHDEMATFVMYIQNGKFWPYHAIVDANNHFLNSFLAHYSFKLFGFSALALRLPNLFAFLLMAITGYRFLFHFKSDKTRWIFIGFLFLSFHWLGFFTTCRGYGLSMAFLMLSFLFIVEYFKIPKWYFFIGFVLAIQIGITANLTLLLISLLLTGWILLFQIQQKLWRDRRVLITYFFHLALIGLWVDYSFFLQEGNALYYGEGNSYWEITFVTLIELLTGFVNNYLDIFIAILVSFFSIISLYFIFKKKWLQQFKWNNNLFFFTSLFIGSITVFFILHQWKGINYPEDRTGLFFYPIAFLMIIFLIEELADKWKNFFLIIPILFSIHFISLLNFQNHPMNEYETFPERFYTMLLKEQENNEEKITISGHRLNELLFTFFNYKYGAKLNPVDDSEQINLHGDYMITQRKDWKRVSPFYTIIDSADWDFILLKRKEKCLRKLIFTQDSMNWKEGNDEFIEFFRVGDTIFEDTSPLLVEMLFDVDHAAQPFDGFLVLDIQDEEGKRNYYKRIPLQWLRYSWNHTKNNHFMLMTDKLPERIKSMVIYLWCSRKQFIRIKMNRINLYNLIK